MIRRTILAFLLVVSCGGAFTASGSAEPPSAAPDPAATDTTAVVRPDATGSPTDFAPDMIVLPPANHTQLPEAAALMEEVLYRHLRRTGLSFLNVEAVRPILRAHRIRSRGTIGRDDAELLAGVTGARYLVLVSWDVFKTADNPEVALSMRVLDLRSMSLLGAVSPAATGEDFTGLLGRGTVEAVEELVDIVMDRAVSALFPLSGLRTPPPPGADCVHLAVVPFDNYSDTAFAGDIVSNIVLSRLMGAGYFVVEPGFVAELGLKRETVNRGRIDWYSARALGKDYGTCRILTGDVEVFDTAPGDAWATVPRFALGVRVMVPESGDLLMMKELQGSGEDGEWVFQQGRQHALVHMVEDALGSVLDELDGSN